MEDLPAAGGGRGRRGAGLGSDKADLSELAGWTVRVRFSLLNAELYAFWFAD